MSAPNSKLLLQMPLFLSWRTCPFFQRSSANLQAFSSVRRAGFFQVFFLALYFNWRAQSFFLVQEHSLFLFDQALVPYIKWRPCHYRYLI